MRSGSWVGIAKRGEIRVSQSGSDMELWRGRRGRKRIGRVDEGWSSGGVQLENEDGRGREGIRTTAGGEGTRVIIQAQGLRKKRQAVAASLCYPQTTRHY